MHAVVSSDNLQRATAHQIAQGRLKPMTKKLLIAWTATNHAIKLKAAIKNRYKFNHLTANLWFYSCNRSEKPWFEEFFRNSLQRINISRDAIDTDKSVIFSREKQMRLVFLVIIECSSCGFQRRTGEIWRISLFFDLIFRRPMKRIQKKVSLCRTKQSRRK